MPRVKGKYQHIKVLRPPGTPYGTGASKWPGFLSDFGSSVAVGMGVEMAVNGAIRDFELEFGRPPRRDIMVVEVACDTNGAHATVFEINPDRNDDEAAQPPRHAGPEGGQG